MAALSADIEVSEKQGRLAEFPCAVDIIYKGAMVKHNAAGYLAPCAAEAGAVFAGIAAEQVDNSAGNAGDKAAKVIKKGEFLLTGSGFAQTDVGVLVWASDDQTITKTEPANGQCVGRISKYVSATQVWVELITGGKILGDAIESDEVVLAEGNVLVGNSSGVGSALDASGNAKIVVGNGTTVTSVAVSGDVTIDNAGAVTIAAGVVEKGMLATGVKPSHMIVYAGEVTTVGGAATEAFTVTGALATDLLFVQMHTDGAVARTILQGSITGADTMTIEFSGDPSNDHVVAYQVVRATA